MYDERKYIRRLALLKLVEFSVTNYRSITDANKISLQSLTVLVGKNNEGKSNILNALNVSMTVVLQHGGRQRPLGWRSREQRVKYNWATDFPLQYQNRKSGLESIFKMQFQLDNGELSDFHSATGIRGNESISIRVRIGKDNIPKVDVPKKGTSSYNRKSEEVTRFVSDRIRFNYIKAIRTEGMAIEALNQVIEERMRTLQENEEYKGAIDKIKELRQGVLDDIANRLLSPLTVFLPTLSHISITQNEPEYFIPRYLNRGEIDILLNDGLATSICNKGDGIKSLVTLAILKDKQKTDCASVIAIEEPESHLHSGAIHSLVDVMHKMAEDNQLIITTHNPLFIQQNRIPSNIIVDNGKARPAKSIAEIRDILGVLPSDNLMNAKYLVLVEGESDALSLSKLLPVYDEKIKNALISNTLVIKPIKGASNLSHEIMEAKQFMCQFVVLVDDDSAGAQAANKALESGLLKQSQLKTTVCVGSKEAEFEDCLKPKVYSDQIKGRYNVDLDCPEFRGNDKWSIRMERTFMNQGTKWTDSLACSVKYDVASAISNALTKSMLNEILIEQKSGFIDGLVLSILQMLDSH